MTVKDFKKYQTLSQICDNTFGKGSLVRATTQTVNLRLVDDDTMTATFIMVVNFGNDNQMRQMMPRFRNDATSMVEAALKKVEEDYKEKTNKKVSLKLKPGTVQDNVEFLSYQIYNPKKTAYYRLSCVVDVK